MRKRVKLIKLSRIIWKNELEKSYKSIEKRQCLKYNFNVCFSQSGCFWGRGKKTPKINKRKGEVFMVNKIKKLQKEVKENLKTNNGITLIALVITIIVLLILAGVSIAMLTGDNGILTQAQNAKNKTSEAEAQERQDLEDQNALIDNLANGKSLVQPGVVVDSTIKNNYIDTNGEKATVPAGFTVSGIESEQKVSEGLVIYDIPEGVTPNWTEDIDGIEGPDIKTKYNQFVWIPVAGKADYQRDFSYPSYYGSSSETTPEGSTFTEESGYLPDGIKPEIENSENNEIAERTAVLKYNGFYIGRYEAGQENETILVSKQNIKVWSDIAQPVSMEKSKIMYENNNYVKSGLCSGIQWDMVMHFVEQKIDGTGDKVFDVRVADSTRHTERGYCGTNINDKVQNIYDLEGSCWEWVAEKNNIKSRYPLVVRGGYQNEDSSASSRHRTNYTTEYFYTFRPVLYII